MSETTHNVLESVWTKRVKEQMAGYAERHNIKKMTLQMLANGLWKQRLGREAQDRGTEFRPNDPQMNVAPPNFVKTVERAIKGGTGGKPYPKYDLMKDIADYFGVHLGFLIGETNSKTFTLEDASEYLGLEDRAVEAIRRMTWIVSKEWLLSQGKSPGSKPSKSEAEVVDTIFECTNARPATCRAVLNRVLIAEGFEELLLSLNDIRMAGDDAVMARIEYEVSKLRFEDDDPNENGDSSNYVEQPYSAEKRVREAEHKVKVSRYEAYEAYMRLIEELFSDQNSVDAKSVARRIVATQPSSTPPAPPGR